MTAASRYRDGVGQVKANITPAMMEALRKIAKNGCAGLAGRMGEALVKRGLATAKGSECSEYPLRNFGEGRYGYFRRDYYSIAYYPTEAGLSLLKTERRNTLLHRTSNTA